MKTLLGALLVTFFICVTAAAQEKAAQEKAAQEKVAQEKNDRQQPDQSPAPAKRDWLELMRLSQPQQQVQTNDGKTEAQFANPQRTIEFISPIQIVMIEGAVYTSIGDLLLPWPGGGASGCFDPTGIETAARIEKARAEWAKRPRKN